MRDIVGIGVTQKARRVAPQYVATREVYIMATATGLMTQLIAQLAIFLWELVSLAMVGGGTWHLTIIYMKLLVTTILMVSRTATMST